MIKRIKRFSFTECYSDDGESAKSLLSNGYTGTSTCSFDSSNRLSCKNYKIFYNYQIKKILKLFYDYQIAGGYGRHLRRMIQNYNTYDHQELPLVIGRGCAGVVEGVGRNSKSGLEIGDEV